MDSTLLDFICCGNSIEEEKMKQVDRTKVCWSCEAEVNYEATYCPFCGTDLLTSTMDSKENQPSQDDRFEKQSLEESLASLYKPPYSIRNRQGLGVPDEREEPQFKQVEPPKQEHPLFQSYETLEAERPVAKVSEKEGEEKKEGGGVLPLLLLLTGIHLVVLGILILFFSKGGIVSLEWNASYWFFYVLIGVALSYLGARFLKHLSHSSTS
jgi:ribosomal protein L40E